MRACARGLNHSDGNEAQRWRNAIAVKYVVVVVGHSLYLWSVECVLLYGHVARQDNLAAEKNLTWAEPAVIVVAVYSRNITRSIGKKNYRLWLLSLLCLDWASAHYCTFHNMCIMKKSLDSNYTLWVVYLVTCCCRSLFLLLLPPPPLLYHCMLKEPLLSSTSLTPENTETITKVSRW